MDLNSSVMDEMSANASALTGFANVISCLNSFENGPSSLIRFKKRALNPALYPLEHWKYGSKNRKMNFKVLLVLLKRQKFWN